MSVPQFPERMRPLSVPLQIAAGMLALIAPFVFPPPAAWVDAPSNDVWVPLLHVVLVVTVGALLAIAARNRSFRSEAWLVGSIGALLTGIALFAVYLLMHSMWACAYVRLPSGVMTYIVLGSTLIPNAPAEAVDAIASRADCSEVVWNVAGKTNLVWDRTELLSRQMALAALFTTSSAAFATAIVCLVEALRRAPSRTPPSRRVQR
jgi:hypothetical protein